MQLEIYERDSALWLKLKGHMEERIEMLRNKNEGNLDPIPTAHIRGRIRALKDMLALAEPGPTQVRPDE